MATDHYPSRQLIIVHPTTRRIEIAQVTAGLGRPKTVRHYAWHFSSEDPPSSLDAMGLTLQSWAVCPLGLLGYVVANVLEFCTK